MAANKLIYIELKIITNSSEHTELYGITLF